MVFAIAIVPILIFQMHFAGRHHMLKDQEAEQIKERKELFSRADLLILWIFLQF